MSKGVTLGVAMIVKDEVDRVTTLITALRDYVDAFSITVSDKKAYQQLKVLKQKNIVIVHRDWTDNFAEARNSNHELIHTDYWLWIDADDILRGRENLRGIAQSMHDSGVDVMYFPYHYKINERGETVNYQWRERLIRTSLKGEWKGAVHETFVPEGHYEHQRLDAVQYYHITDKDHQDTSTERNHKILEKLYDTKNPDPRDIYYLATSHFNQGNWDEATKLFLEHIQKSGWDEEKYYSWLYIAEGNLHKKNYDRAISACFGATEILPHYPDAYFVLQQIYYELERYEKSVEWYSIGASKQRPETNRVVDPTVTDYRAKFQAAVSLMCLGQPKTAFKYINEVRKAAPNTPEVEALYPEFVRAYNEAEAIEHAKYLAVYAKDFGGNGKAVIDALPKELQMDVRLREVRAEVIPPKVWPKKSIVFYCGPALEQWGPDTLDKGMGGSEEAIVYLSRELAKQGWQVTVYNDREESYSEESWGKDWKGTISTMGDPLYGGKYHRIIYAPFTTFNPADTFDVLVAWRSPQFHRIANSKARLRVVDMHDVPGNITDEDLAYIDKFFVKSEYHRSLLKNVPDSKVVIIPNGIVLDQFEGDILQSDGTSTDFAAPHRNPYKVIYGSSADRGLETLLDMWPQVKEAVPEAELVWAYGWESFDAAHKKDSDMMKWKWNMIRKMHDVGCTSLGRLSHEDLAIEYRTSSVWAYPTEFAEISCITAMKAGKAGVIPVTSNFAALKETIQEPQTVCTVETIVQALKEGRDEETRFEMSKLYDQFSWEHVAEGWNNACS